MTEMGDRSTQGGKVREQQFITDLLEQNAGLTRELAEAKDALAQAFFAGAKWWNWKQTGATMWQSDQHEVFAAAREQYPYVMFREQILARERDEALAKLKVCQEAVEKMHGSARVFEEVETVVPSFLIADAEALAAETPELFYIQNTVFVESCLLWWTPKGRDCTYDLKQAWKVDRETANRLTKKKGKYAKVWPAALVDRCAQLHVTEELLKEASDA